MAPDRPGTRPAPARRGRSRRPPGRRRPVVPPAPGVPAHVGRARNRARGSADAGRGRRPGHQAGLAHSWQQRVTPEEVGELLAVHPRIPTAPRRRAPARNPGSARQPARPPEPTQGRPSGALGRDVPQSSIAVPTDRGIKRGAKWSQLLFCQADRGESRCDYRRLKSAQAMAPWPLLIRGLWVRVPRGPPRLTCGNSESGLDHHRSVLYRSTC
jgi:hypothetical protein